jgi:DsbC/DsbD-like thiol-disulfide interchange protein
MNVAVRVLAALLAFSAAWLPQFAIAADGASPWVQGFHSRVRLVSGGLSDGRRLAGVEIQLDPGFKTYWRTPGDSGLPPRFDWSDTRGAATIDLEWPAPQRTTDAGGVAYSYSERVLFPVIVTPETQADPTFLRLDIEYGVCKDICIPAQAELELALGDDPRHRVSIDAARDAVPRPAPVGADAPLAIRSITTMPGKKPSIEVEVRAPVGMQPSLFAEGPDGSFVSTSEPTADQRFIVTVEELPKDLRGSIPLRLTLTSGGEAIEAEARLDASVAAR